MKHIDLFFLFISFCCVCNCSNHKQVEITSLRHQTIDVGDQFIGYGGHLTVFKDKIIGLDLAPAMQPFFFVKQTNSTQLFYFGHKGQGPNEFLKLLSIQNINNQTIGAFDNMLKTYFEFNIPNENEELHIDKKIIIQFQEVLTQVFKIAYDQYLGIVLGEKMFLLADSSGVPVNTFFEYPYQDMNERKFADRAFAYQGSLAINPAKNKFIYASYYAEIIHFYEIGHNKIDLITKIEKEYPLFSKRNDEYQGVILDRKGKVGYIATYATDSFVYALFNGKTVGEIGKGPNFEAQILRVFDWNGTLVKEYELDVPTSYLCVSNDDSKIWAIASTPEIALVTFDLKNNIANKQGENKPKERDLINSNNSDKIRIGLEFHSEEEQKKIMDSINDQRKKGQPIRINTTDNVNIRIDTIKGNK